MSSLLTENTILDPVSGMLVCESELSLVLSEGNTSERCDSGEVRPAPMERGLTGASSS